MTYVLTVKKENEGKKDEAFVVRGQTGSIHATFAYRGDADLFALMSNCEECRERIRDKHGEWCG